MTTAQGSLSPVVCTLTTKQLGERSLEWSDLADLALTRQLIDDGVASTYPLSLADKIEDLANREASCCGSWLDTSTSRTADTVRLELTTTNPEGLALITAMIGEPAH